MLQRLGWLCLKSHINNMFNLLPNQQKKAIYKEYNSRRIVITINFLNLTGLIALILLIPLFFLINLKHRASQEEIKNLQIETPELKDVQNLELAASKTAAQIKLLNKFPVLPPLSIWEKIIKNKSAGIKIKSFYYSNENADTNVSIKGTALSREALTNFGRSLESEAQFKNVNLPVSSLARGKDLDFQISFLVVQNKQ